MNHLTLRHSFVVAFWEYVSCLKCLYHAAEFTILSLCYIVV